MRTVLNWTHPASGRTYVHKLADPSTDFSTKNMRQLAQVADGSTSHLSLVLKDDKLALSGVEFCCPVAHARRNDGFVPGIKISIKGPGHIEYQEGTLAVAYKKGRQVRLRPLNLCNAVQSWLTDAEHALRHDAILSLKSEPCWETNQEQPRFPDGIMLTFLCSVIRTIESGGHGGTILVLPTAGDAKCIDLRFPAASSDLKALVRRFGEASLLAAKEGFRTTPPLAPTLIDEGVLMSTVEAYGIAFAKLANCDGAILMTRDANLLGFGGIIQSPAPSVLANLEHQSRGARHTSAQWLCESVSDSIAIVVSADRSITLIHSTGGNPEILTDFVVW